MNSLSAILEEQRALMERLSPRQTETFREELARCRRVFFTGAGRTMLMLRVFAMRLMHLGYTVYLAGDTTTPAIGEGDLLVAASGSGETAGVLLNARKALEAGARLAVITASPHSSLGKLAHCLVEFPIATEKSPGGSGFATLQPGGSAFEQGILLWGDALVLDLLRELPSGTSVMTLHANLE